MALQQITDNIWLGSLLALQGKQTLKKNNVTHVLSVLDIQATGFSEKDFCENVRAAGLKHLYLNVQDVEEENLMQFFDQTNNFIDEAVNGGGGVFVHCIAGISRSSTCVCAWLMSRKKMTPDEAIAFVKSKRPIANPNEGFREQLAVYYKCGFRVSDDCKPYREWKLKQQARELEYQTLRSLPTTYTPVELPPLAVTWWHIMEWLVNSKALATKVSTVSIGDKKYVVSEPIANCIGGGDDIHIKIDGESTITVPEAKVRDLMAKVSRRVVVLRCKGCSSTLVTSGSFVGHARGHEGLCQHHFIEPVEWMRPELEKGELEGKLLCGKCSYKLGSYQWQGSKCSCGTWVVPAIKLQKSRVDEMTVQDRPAAAL